MPVAGPGRSVVVVEPVQRQGRSVMRGLLASVLMIAALAASGLASAQEIMMGHPAPTANPPKLERFEEAFTRVATELFSKLKPEDGRVVVVVDPLIDGATGLQTKATRGLDQRIAGWVAERFPFVEVVPLTGENLARAKFVFIGTFNPINNAGQAQGPRDAFWLCFALVDLSSKQV